MSLRIALSRCEFQVSRVCIVRPYLNTQRETESRHLTRQEKPSSLLQTQAIPHMIESACSGALLTCDKPDTDTPNSHSLSHKLYKPLAELFVLESG